MPVAAEGIPVATRRPSAREIVASVALAAAGFLVTAGVLHAAIGDPLRLHADVRSEKLEMLREWHGRVFSAAFGTSHVHNGFDPQVFDETLAGSPLATRSANLAVEGGAQPEQYVMAEEFLKQLESPAQANAGNQPCLVLLELGAGANFTPDHMMTARAINIYDWPAARLVTHLVGPQMGAEQRYGRIGYALITMGLHYSNVGMLSNAILKPPLSQTRLTDETRDDRRGQMVMPHNDVYLQRMYRIIKDYPKQPVIVPEETLRGNVEMVQELAAISAVKNVSFVYVVMPKLTDLFGGPDFPDHLTVPLPGGAMEVPIINLARADRFPQMYDPNLWHDEAHVHGEGSKLVTRILAEQLKQWYALHGEPKPCG